MTDWLKELAELTDAYDVTSTFTLDKRGTSRYTAHQPGLYVQLLDELGEKRREFGTEGGSHDGKPESRPPGWRSDVSDLLDDIAKGVRGHRRRAGLFARVEPLEGLKQLPNFAVADDVTAKIAEDVHQWHRLARLTLGYQVPSRPLPDTVCYKRRYVRGGYVDRGCGEHTLRVAIDIQSDVWCANPDCHDDDENPGCRDDDGALTCRRTERDLRHNYRWTQDEWLALWEDQQRRARQEART